MIEQGEWRVVHALDEPVAADGPPKAGTNIRNLEGMCELANALTAENKRLKAGLERIAADAEGCERLPDPGIYDYVAALDKTYQDLALDHAAIAREALEEVRKL